MRSIGAHAAAVLHRHGAAGKQRLLVALAKGLQGLKGTNGLDGNLAEVHAGRDLAGVLELLGVKLRQDGLKAVAKLAQARGLAGHAHGARVAAKTHQHVGALLDGVEEVDRAHRAARAAGDAVADGEDDRRDVVAVDDARGHDALHALVPALAAHHDAVAHLALLGDLDHSLVTELCLDLAAVGVDLFELAGKDGCLVRVFDHEQVKGHVGRAHAARGVKARDDVEGQVIGCDLGNVDACGGG